jgi:hypothetical protein
MTARRRRPGSGRRVAWWRLQPAFLTSVPAAGDSAIRGRADELKVSARSLLWRRRAAVKTHVHNAFAELGISAREQLAQLVREAD